MKRFLIFMSAVSVMLALYYGSSARPLEDDPFLRYPVDSFMTVPSEPPAEIIESHLITGVEIREISSVDPDRDYLLWSKTTDALEALWEQEVFSHIQYIDRERADVLYRNYRQERIRYMKSQEESLAASLNELSRLNGESITDEDSYVTPEIRHEEFITSLKRNFRQNYGYIEDQRKIFLDAHALR